MSEQNQNAFLEFLSKSPEMLATFVSIVKAFLAQQSAGVKIPVSNEPKGPKKFKLDQKPSVELDPITDAEMDALTKGFADAIVKEKALQYIKGFIAGFMVRGI